MESTFRGKQKNKYLSNFFIVALRHGREIDEPHFGGLSKEPQVLKALLKEMIAIDFGLFKKDLQFVEIFNQLHLL